MKRFFALILTLAMTLSLLAIPAAAELTEFKWTVHNSPNKHEKLMVMETTVGVVIENKLVEREHMTTAQMKDVVKAVLEDEEQTLIPEDMDIPLALNRGIPLRDMNFYAQRAYENIARRITGQRIPLLRARW